MVRKSLLYIFFISLSLAFQTADSTGNEILRKLQTEMPGTPDSFDIADYPLLPGPYNLCYNRELLLLGSGGIMGITGLVLMNNITPLTAEQIDQLNLDDINSFDRHSVGRYRDTNSGDILLYTSFLMPLTFLIDQRARRDWKTLGVIGIETVLIQSGLNAIVKALTLRTRPYVYDPDTPMDKKTSKDARISFYSGHTATTTALTFYIAKVFSDYLSDNSTKTLIWTGAAIYPAFVAYLRRDSGHHFYTDVITGYIIGATIGYFIPEMHKTSRNERFSVRYMYSGKCAGIGLAYNF